MKFKLNRLELKWVLYDVGNSAFTLLISTIMPIYFNYLAGNAGISDVDYLAYWGYATSISTVIVAILGPTLGTVSDLKGFKKKIFMAALLVGAIGCIFLGFMSSWLWFLLIFVIAKSAYSLSLVVYDSMLTDVTTKDRMDEVSAHGYAWGYIGSCIPFILSLLLVLFYENIGLTMSAAMSIAFLLIALWWLFLAVPLLRSYEQKYYVSAQSHPVRSSFSRLGHIFRELGNNKKILFFLIAFFFYIDGVYTIIDMATAYGTALGLDTTGLLLALLLTQIVAFPAALIFGRLSRKMAIGRIIMICIAAYFVIALYGMGLNEQYQFWILAVCVGIFQGAIQSMSRSYFAKIIPANQSGEYFGVYDICGKGASFAGTTLVSFVSQATGNVNLGVGALSVMFAIGFVFFILADNKAKEVSI
ncbi:MFS transporter [Catenibacillus scindens]|uniref:MFS transporter n=1 Tax=Catenibacillus scindens TaxID=673271 RepID=UPI00320A0344